MISFIRGELAAVEPQKAIVDVGGVGYGVYMSQQALSLLPPVGNEVKLYTYLNVKEDAMAAVRLPHTGRSRYIQTGDRCERDRSERRA